MEKNLYAPLMVRWGWAGLRDCVNVRIELPLSRFSVSGIEPEGEASVPQIPARARSRCCHRREIHWSERSVASGIDVVHTEDGTQFPCFCQLVALHIDADERGLVSDHGHTVQDGSLRRLHHFHSIDPIIGVLCAASKTKRPGQQN